ncbi:MAG: hypothetical protein ACHQX3_05425 [Nitrospirales bacterium]
MSEKKEVIPAPKTELADWQKQLAEMAIATAEAEKPQGNWVSFKSGVLSVGGNPIKGNKMKVVVVHSAFENQIYKNKYDSNNPGQTPHCYAIAENEEDLKPHPDAAEPQADTCEVCPNNVWGSDPEGGRGKACKNVRRLAMIAFDDMGDINKAPVAMAKLPVTSVKNWSTYANQIANVLKLPPLAVITELSVEPDAKTMFQVNFELVDKIMDGAQIQALLTKRKDTTPLIFSGYEKPSQAPAQQAAGNTKY